MEGYGKKLFVPFMLRSFSKDFPILLNPLSLLGCNLLLVCYLLQFKSLYFIPFKMNFVKPRVIFCSSLLEELILLLNNKCR